MWQQRCWLRLGSRFSCKRGLLACSASGPSCPADRVAGAAVIPPLPQQAYGALTKAFARSGDWRRALEAMQLMQLDGVTPNEQVAGER